MREPVTAIVAGLFCAILALPISAANSKPGGSLPKKLATVGLHNSGGRFQAMGRAEGSTAFYDGFFNVAIDQTNHIVFINQPGSPHIHVLDGQKMVRKPTLAMRCNCAAVCFDQSNSLLWASVGSERKGGRVDHYYVVMVKPETGQVAQPIQVYSKVFHPHFSFAGIGVDEGKGTVFVSGTSEDFVVGTNAKGSVGRIAVDKGPVDIAVDTDNRRCFVANYYGNSVSVIDVDRLAENKCLAVGKEPFSLALDTTRYKLFVACKGAKSIHIVDTEKVRLLAFIALEDEPGGVGVRERDGRLFVSLRSKNQVVCFDSSDLRGVGTVSVGKNPGAIGVNQELGIVYVVNEGDGKADRSVTAIR